MTEKRQFLRIAKTLCATFVAQIGNSAPYARVVSEADGGGVVKSSKCKVQSADNAKPDTRERVILSEVESETQRDERGSRFGIQNSAPARKRDRGGWSPSCNATRVTEGVIGKMGNAVKTFFSSLLIVFVTLFALPAFADTMCNLYNKADGVLYGYPTANITWSVGAGTGENSELTIRMRLTEGKTYTAIRAVAGGTPAFRIQASPTETLTNGQSLVNINSAGNTNTKTFVVPTGAPYVLFYVRNTYGGSNPVTKDEVINGFMVVEGSTAPTEYIPYNTNCGVVSVGACNNLFDKTTVTANKYITPSGSITSDGTNRTVVSGEIYVKPSTTYTLSGVGNIYDASYNRSGFQYQADGTPISAITATQNTGIVTFTTDANCAYVRVMSVTANVDTAMLEEGSTATDYVPFCAQEIKIATTAYNSARFSPVVTDLNSTIATIRDVVTNTINQTKAIADLQATKQTRPDAECPKFRQCLLVEDDNGTPHWYLIKDPVRDLVTSLRDNKINNAGETTTTAYAANGYDGTNGTTNSRYYKGYPAMRLKTSAQSSSVNNRQFSSTLLNGANGGQYKTLGDQEWAVTWDGNETGTADSFLPGVIYGTSRCVKTSEAPTTTYAAKVNPGTAGWTLVENSDALNDLENIEQYMSCFCKMTGVGLDGAITPVRDSSLAPWVFDVTLDASGCAERCAFYCGGNLRYNVAFRQAILGWAVE